jgi:hypothetical protein
MIQINETSEHMNVCSGSRSRKQALVTPYRSRLDPPVPALARTQSRHTPEMCRHTEEMIRKCRA